MQYFVAVAEELSFRKAAVRLNIAQPALSRAIQGLEAAVESTLLLRSRKGVELTEAGQVFFDGCQRTLHGVWNLVEEVGRAQNGEIGRVVIGYTDFAISGALPSLLQHFRSRYPRITVTLEHMVTCTQLAALNNGAIDLGFVTGPVSEDGIRHITVQRDRLVAILPTRHPLARHQYLSLKDLASEPFVIGQRASWGHFLNHMNAVCSGAGFMPKVVQEAFNSEGIFGLIAADMGVTLHVESARNYVRKGLVVRDLWDTDHVVPTVAAWSEINNSAPLRHLIEFIGGWLESHRETAASHV